MRLIDADELMEHVWRDKLDSRELIAKMIDDAPTVKEISTKIPINVFEQLISQESKTRHWIPVSERLPEESGNYLITYCLQGEIETQEAVYVKDEEDKWFDITNIEITLAVIAWMPLPEPYKAESEEV
jgi:hypothetical protein